MKHVEVLIAPMHGETDPPPIAITFKQGQKTLIRVEMNPADFALAITGRLVIGEITRGMAASTHETQGTAYDPGATGYELQGRAAAPTTPKGEREP
jgi:hypothetical protein